MNTPQPKIKWYWYFSFAFFISTILNVTIWTFSKFKEPPKLDFIFTGLLVLMAYACLESVRFFQKKYYYSSLFKANYLNKSIVAFGSVLIGTLVFDIQFYFFKWLDYYVNNSEPPFFHHMLASTLIGFLMSSIFGLMEFAIHWKNENYNNYIENESYKKEIIKSNLNILRHQLDPHFMFNNFNTLYYLIEENPILAQQFLKNISNIYRYILQNNEKSLIPAIEEYNICKKYLEIIKQRYGKNLQVTDYINISELENKSLPPLVLQQLIENVIKHNRIDKISPVTLTIKVNENELIVTNDYNPKRSESVNGSGLKNIEKRYQFLSNKAITVFKDDNLFTVKIPLIAN